MNNKVLIIEDEEILVKILEQKFRDGGFLVETAGDGEVALPMTKEFLPDIIVLDLLLPKKHGFDVLKELKLDQGLKDIPVIILSNLGQEAEIKKGMELGAADYLVKAQNPIKAVIEKVKSYAQKLEK